MKILYVTGMCDPITDILTGKTENEITHSPGFFHPWFKLVQRGHQVDFVVASNFNNDVHVKVDWFSEENIVANVYDPYSETPWYGRIFRRLKRFGKLLYYTNKAISENDYDFVYCKAFYEGLAGNIVANFRNVPCGMRSMGTMLNIDFEKYGVLGTAFKRPIEYLTFKLKKDFFIMTDDGTRGDIIYKEWKPKKKHYDYYFWKTGVAIENIEDINSTIQIPDHDYLFFAARFDNWKRHDRILDLLRILHDQGLHLHLYFAGGVQSRSYHATIHKMVKSLKLEDYVHFLGPVKQHDLKVLAYRAIANPLMYDVSNLGNVFFESFSTGAIVIGINDGSLEEYITHNKNGFIVNNEEEAAKVIRNVLQDNDYAQIIRRSAVISAREKVLTIDERFDMEVDLIEKTVEMRRASELD
jgi:glycosyltransferase involved in cell wall biosynthesis